MNKPSWTCPSNPPKNAACIKKCKCVSMHKINKLFTFQIAVPYFKMIPSEPIYSMYLRQEKVRGWQRDFIIISHPLENTMYTNEQSFTYNQTSMAHPCEVKKYINK